MSAEAPLALAQSLVERARKAGADQADALAVAATEQDVTVRRGAVEKVIEAGSRSLGLRVIVGGRQAVVSTADVSAAALDEAVTQAMALAQISEPDACAGLPEAWELAAGAVQLQLYDEAVEQLTAGQRIEAARTCEASALGADPRIVNTDGATFSTRVATVALANSAGFSGQYLSTAASLSVEVMADQGDGNLRNDFWFSAGRHLHRLDSAEAVGREAAARALRQLGATKASTQVVPVVMEPRMTGALISALVQAASGEAYYRRATFLRDRVGQVIGSALLSVTDDPLIPGALGSRPFDGEGVRTRANPLLEAGVFRGFLFDTYSARRAGQRSTGSASRGVGSLPSVGSSNVVVQAGASDPASIIGGVENGLYLTGLMGFGYNPTTGDFSRGAQGIWIRNGELAEAVTEINVSGRLDRLLGSIDAVGNDAQWFGSVCAPTVRLASVQVSGV